MPGRDILNLEIGSESASLSRKSHGRNSDTGEADFSDSSRVLGGEFSGRNSCL